MRKDIIPKIIGAYRCAYACYSNDSSLRQFSASGGGVTTLLISALKKKKIDGALVCRTVIEKGKVFPVFYIAKTADDFLLSMGSKYVQADFNGQAMRLIESYKGKLAVVGLPCNLMVLRKRCDNNPELKKKIKFTIALFCGHGTTRELIDTITPRLENEAGSVLTDFSFRTGHWRGVLSGRFANGKEIVKKTSYYNLYQNLYFFAEKKCLSCYDHFGYLADISAGDIWTSEYKKKDIKHTGLIIRTIAGEQIISIAKESKMLFAEEVMIDKIFSGQKRVAPTHYNVSARKFAGKILGISISETNKSRFNMVDLLIALIILANWKWSQSNRLSKLIFYTPRIILKIFLYLLKGLETVR
ncbi:MAG: coenzyme F420-reducing hydrogenase subunit beta [Ignavibacteria bacterium ADurb.Bin266]|nr:MAG: coenzyme F420-reducing hydrogenase subunit beta [Ignavibacteria bacterium ADurb.Bin266]